MERFNLDTWLQDKSRKVVTRDGRKVRILCWDAESSKPIVALVSTRSISQRQFNDLTINYFNDGTYYGGAKEDFLDLFFADKEEELTDFESDLFTAFSDAWQQYLRGESVDVAKWAKEHSKDLIESARKEIYEDMKSLSKEK